MLDAAKVGQGRCFFDAGCGGGGASVLAAQRGAHVSGLDASEAPIAIARERVPHGDFRVGDLEALPYRMLLMWISPPYPCNMPSTQLRLCESAS
jgi:cyclopropane fatty-acyl-phospholipid synthase-like methyltransferase